MPTVNMDMHRAQDQYYTPKMPERQQMDEVQQFSSRVLPFVERLLSGENIQGLDAMQARQLMQAISPEQVHNMHLRGMEVDPNWYRQYIQPGVVDRDTFNTIQNYARGFYGTPFSTQAMDVVDQPIYQYGGGSPSWHQTLDRMRRTQGQAGWAGGQVFDPHRNAWVLDPSIAQEVMNEVVDNAGGVSSLDDPNLGAGVSGSVFNPEAAADDTGGSNRALNWITKGLLGGPWPTFTNLDTFNFGRSGPSDASEVDISLIEEILQRNLAGDQSGAQTTSRPTPQIGVGGANLTPSPGGLQPTAAPMAQAGSGDRRLKVTGGVTGQQQQAAPESSISAGPTNNLVQAASMLRMSPVQYGRVRDMIEEIIRDNQDVNQVLQVLNQFDITVDQLQSADPDLYTMISSAATSAR